jgi:hypothetical protein
MPITGCRTSRPSSFGGCCKDGQPFKAMLGSSTLSSQTALHHNAGATSITSAGDVLTTSKPSRYIVIYAPAAKKQKKSWKEASLIVSEHRAVLFDTTLQKSIASCGAQGGKNPLFDQMASRPGKSFDEGDEIVMNGSWSIQIITVMHRHLCPYDEVEVAPVQHQPSQLVLPTAKEKLHQPLHAASLRATNAPPQYLKEVTLNSQNLPSFFHSTCNFSPPPPLASQTFLTGRRPLRTKAEILDMMMPPKSPRAGGEYLLEVSHLCSSHI